MKIQILGSGCRKCKELYANAENAVKSSGVECELEKVTDIEKIVAMGVMTTPALAIDGKVVSSGKVLTEEEISQYLTSEHSCCSGSSCSCQSEPTKPPCCCGGKKKGGFFKKIITIILLLFVAGSILYIIERENKTVTGKQAEVLPMDVLKVYYFHGTKRCMTCNTIEKLTRDAVGNSENVNLLIFFAADNEENVHGVMHLYSVNPVQILFLLCDFHKKYILCVLKLAAVSASHCTLVIKAILTNLFTKTLYISNIELYLANF